MKTAEHIVKEKNRAIIYVAPDAPVFDTLKVMVENNIGSVLIKEGENYIGIYTEREFVNNAAGENFNPGNTKISDVMVTDLVYADASDTLHQLQDKLLGKCLRHLLIQKEGNVIGLVSAGDITRADLNEHEKTLKSVSWNYYEDWRWGKQK